MGTLIIVALILAFIPAFIASYKGRSFTLWYFYGFMLFLVALIHSICISTSEKALCERGELKKCPFCAEYVKKEAKVCKHCGKELPEVLPIDKENKTGENELPNISSIDREDKTEINATGIDRIHRATIV